jgi:hypothetical protein
MTTYGDMGMATQWCSKEAHHHHDILYYHQRQASTALLSPSTLSKAKKITRHTHMQKYVMPQCMKVHKKQNLVDLLKTVKAVTRKSRYYGTKVDTMIQKQELEL